MKKSRTLLLSLLVCVLLVSVLAGGAYAYMFRQTETVTNDLIPAEVKCQVIEEFGENTKTAINVKNTGNIDAYLRVRLVTYWVNDDNEIVAKPSKQLSVSFSNGWMRGSGDTYYYTSPVAPGETPSVNLLSAPLTLTSEDGYKQVVEVFAEAIQSLPEKAAEEAWKVTVTDGKITAVP